MIHGESVDDVGKPLALDLVLTKPKDVKDRKTTGKLILCSDILEKTIGCVKPGTDA